MCYVFIFYKRNFDELCYKPEGRGFDSRCHWIFSVYLILAVALTEMTIRCLPGDKGWPARKVNSHIAICEPIAYE
jgi:hypothetical protein